ncbi:MAG: hypothetical protein WA294_09560 [Acidobacteriaceae bacterium]
MARRIAVLALLALALGAGTFVLARSSVKQAPAAELSFNPDAAYHDDFALTRTGDPAVAAAQSILSDAVVLDLLLKASASLANGPDAIGDFRSRLDLTEPWPETLQVRYRDPEPRAAAVVANAVATALADGPPPVRSPATRHPKGSAKAKNPAWENPYRIMRLASVPPRILAEPAWLATGISALFFAAGVLGGFLFWQRAMQGSHTEAAGQDGGAFTLLPPMLVAKPTPGQEFAAVRLEAAEVVRPADPEEGWEWGAREPEGLGESGEPVSSAAGEPAAQLPFMFQIDQRVGIDAPFLPRPPAPQLVQPMGATTALEIVPEASQVPRESEAAKIEEMRRPETRRATAPEGAARPAAESVHVDEPPAGMPEGIEKPEGVEEGRVSLLDPGADDAVWSERILLGFAGTSIGQMLEGERRRDGTNGVHRRPPAPTPEIDHAQEPERA